jgi:hypothetical protein
VAVIGRGTPPSTPSAPLSASGPPRR